MLYISYSYIFISPNIEQYDRNMNTLFYNVIGTHRKAACLFRPTPLINIFWEFFFFFRSAILNYPPSFAASFLIFNHYGREKGMAIVLYSTLHRRYYY